MWDALDWGKPWYEPWRELGGPIAREVAAGQSLHAALNRLAPAPVRFIPQSEAPADVPYELHVFESGCCPTRDNLHDFFNGLVWAQFPQSKRCLNRLQAAEIEAQGVGAGRGPVRDAITVFDENGALLDAPAALWDALAARNWQRAFVELRPLWALARVRVFGHALLEKLRQPRKEITAHVWRIQCPIAADTAEVDRWLAAQLCAEGLAGKPFMPLPLLGIPGWCAENQHNSFYDDPQVFRPGRA